jgi:hypothetical protein
MLLEMHSMCLPAMPQVFLPLFGSPLLALLLFSGPAVPDCLIRLTNLLLQLFFDEGIAK